MGGGEVGDSYPGLHKPTGGEGNRREGKGGAPIKTTCPALGESVIQSHQVAG